ncbi:hypothetical protein J3459_017930 [Metarhizium acridum]|uniref:Fido domain-containing protein n=1 Tax=Metarhizium acridum (strain CQMa 102) TaxID=655827 RepID=E9E750_METAQ|nr:uncharacterized protein MAC_05698 [Metarhizium acridum CQMa 102]EFY88225.1 hypothetical protein MAC_05698 [Metarhizium acridum CQMa 102]KAG8408325.1 hypothetical protein J3459_017930 [Metarhizium acridum]
MSSSTKHRRKSLASLFEDSINITPAASTSRRDPSPTKRAMMKHSLRDTISRGWPSASLQKDHVFMTIHADDVYRHVGAVQNPQQLFEKAKDWMISIQNTERDEVKNDLILKELHEAMIRAIFGSNQIERAGLNLDLTIELCRKVFAGAETHVGGMPAKVPKTIGDLKLNLHRGNLGEEVGEVSERDPAYQKQLLELYHKQSDLKDMPAKYILRSRNEVVQHARAFQHIVHAFVVEKKDLSEDLIKETHRILVKGVSIVEEGHPDVSPDQYGGIYRKVVVGAGTTNFTVPQFVPKKMKEMCDALKEELKAAEDKKGIDPFSIASKYSLEFVEIHPFQDGNGRMCRMILNAILCRYAGVIVPIGEQGEERSVYMGIKRRASQEMEGHGEYATFVLEKALPRLRQMKKKLMGKREK